MAQALLKFLEQQYISYDGQTERFVEGVFAIFGHGNVVGLGEAAIGTERTLILRQGKNEQGMAHAAIGFAKQHRRRKIYAVTSSIGPGALNMVTAAGTATVNRIPLLLLPGDVFACRQPDPVLQQVERTHDASMSANDAFKPVSVYWARIERPEQLMSAAIQAMQRLTNPASTGAVTLALPQDVQAEEYDYPAEFLQQRIHYLERPALSDDALARAAECITASKRPLIICGGGVRYSGAEQTLSALADECGIPFAETQAGKGVIPWDHPLNTGGIGVTGTEAANRIAAQADLIIAVGTRLSDFTTASKSAFKNDAAILAINIAPFDAYKMNAIPLVADARVALQQIHTALRDKNYHAQNRDEAASAITHWNEEVVRIGTPTKTDNGGESDPSSQRISQTVALRLLNDELLQPEDIVVSASGSLPGDMQRIWRSRSVDSYHMEYGFSCMGYEVNAAIGIKLAAPQREVYSFVGDGAYAMLHSELITAVQERIKITVLLFDNCGFQVIDNLQTGSGLPSYANEWRARDPQNERLTGEHLNIDWAAQAAAYGVATYRARTVDELRSALEHAVKQSGPVLIDIKVGFKSMTHGYESWWRVGIPAVSEYKTVQERHQESQQQLKTVRQW